MTAIIILARSQKQIFGDRMKIPYPLMTNSLHERTESLQISAISKKI